MGVWGWIGVVSGGVGLIGWLVWRFPKLSDALGGIGDAIGDIDFGSSGDSGGGDGGC